MVATARPPPKQTEETEETERLHSESFWPGLEVGVLASQRWNSPGIYRNNLSEKFSRASYVVPPLQPAMQALPGVIGIGLNDISRFVGEDVPLPCFCTPLICSAHVSD